MPELWKGNKGMVMTAEELERLEVFIRAVIQNELNHCEVTDIEVERARLFVLGFGDEE